MTLSVHHLNCGTMRPVCGRLWHGTGSIFSLGRTVAHCLLVETNDGLMLVETGIGLKYIDDPRKLRRRFLPLIHADFDRTETAAMQIGQLGFSTEDVRHIVLTHLDLDHAGGLADFPNAQVHVITQEYDAAMHPRTSLDRFRYVADEWAHGPKWVVYQLQGENWYGFDNVQEIVPDVLLVPLFGHTAGHCGVAVHTAKGWFLHCGDAYTARDQIGPDPRRGPLGAWFHWRFLSFDRYGGSRVQEQLRELVRMHGEEVSVFCAHDPQEFSHFKSNNSDKLGGILGK